MPGRASELQLWLGSTPRAHPFLSAQPPPPPFPPTLQVAAAAAAAAAVWGVPRAARAVTRVILLPVAVLAGVALVAAAPDAVLGVGKAAFDCESGCLGALFLESSAFWGGRRPKQATPAGGSGLRPAPRGGPGARQHYAPSRTAHLHPRAPPAIHQTLTQSPPTTPSPCRPPSWGWPACCCPPTSWWQCLPRRLRGACPASPRP